MKRILISLLTVCLASCTTLNTVNGTIADRIVQNDVLNTINYFEGGLTRTNFEVINVTRAVRKDNSFIEEWTVQNGNKFSTYVVTLTPAVTGGVDIQVNKKNSI